MGVFQSLGISIFYADTEAKNLMVTSQKLVNLVKLEFGENMPDMLYTITTIAISHCCIYR